MLKPFITAHTGCDHTPDNTIDSLIAGLEAGADIVEVDVGATKDLIPVLQHDGTVTLAGRGIVRLADMTFDELKQYDIIDHHGDGKRRIVPLADILPIVKRSGKQVNLDIKDDRSIDPTAELVRQANMLDQAFFSGCEAGRAHLVQQRHPDIRKLLNASGELFKNSDFLTAVRKTIEDALAASCIGINMYHKGCQPELMQLAAEAGLPVYVWTVNEEEEMRRVIGLDVRSVTTRNLPALVNVVRSLF